jgi:hypothetical protein
MVRQRGRYSCSAYQVALLGSHVTAGETTPHEQEADSLPDTVQPPLAGEDHEQAAHGVEEDEDNGHDDAVDHAAVNTAVLLLSDGRVVVLALVVRRRRSIALLVDEGVLIGGDTGLGEVEIEGGAADVHEDHGVGVGRVDGIARGPRGDPAVGAAEVEGVTARALDIGDHLVALDAGAGEQSDIVALHVVRHGVGLTLARAQGDVAGAVLVHDEHVGAHHAAADAETDPRVARWRLKLEEKVAGAGAGSGLGDAPSELDILGLANGVGSEVSSDPGSVCGKAGC